jgi:amino acid transporter
MRGLYFLSLVLVALCLGAPLAHLFSLPNKIGLDGQDYLLVQQIYRGWAFLGIFPCAALVATLVLAVKARDMRRAFTLAVLAFLLIAAMLALFFIFTYPANALTENWTYLPDNWEALRRRWEYSHAAGALLAFLAFVSLLASLFAAEGEEGRYLQVPSGMRRS